MMHTRRRIAPPGSSIAAGAAPDITEK